MIGVHVRFKVNACAGERWFDAGKEYILTDYEFRTFRANVEVLSEAKEFSGIESAGDAHIQSTIMQIKKRVNLEVITAEKIKANVAKCKRVLITKSYGIGNTITITPAVRMLKKLVPGVQIDLLLDKGSDIVLQGWPEVNAIFTDKKAIKNIQFDFILVGTPDEFKEFDGETVIKADYDDLKFMSEVEANLQMLRVFGWDGKEIPETYVHIDEETKARIGKEFPGKYIAVCAGYRQDNGQEWAFKNWGYQRYAELIGLMLNKKEYEGFQFLIMGTGNDAKVLEHIKSDRILNCCDRPFPESASILSRCEFIICNDTGLMHTAGALGVKQFAIFGATMETKNKNRLTTVIKKDIQCRPCQYTDRYFNCKNIQCMDITAEQVFESISGAPVKRHKLGILIPVFDRYLLTMTTLDNLLNMSGFKDVKVAIVNDGSTQGKIVPLLASFKQKAEALGNRVVIVNHIRNYGQKFYARTIADGIENLSDCEYIAVWANDILGNRMALKAIEKSLKHLEGEIHCIQFFSDDREKHWGGSGFGKELNKAFAYHYFDGVVGIFKAEDLKAIAWNEFSESPEGIWQNVDHIFDRWKWKVAGHKESLFEHIGNLQSVMHPDYRKVDPLSAVNLNLWNIPAVLEANG